MSFKLLTRDQFRNGCLKRDNYKCIICGNTNNLSVHHILERRLFKDEGYYIENGSVLCETHHIQAEQTLLSVEKIREILNITKFPLPEHLYNDEKYDKWGNIILPNGTRLRGELFDDESVQKILKPVLNTFTNRVKYCRTYHLPFSAGLTNDDRIMEDIKNFEGKNVVVAVKYDGENTTLYKDYIHCRSIEYDPHPSRNYMKILQAKIGYDIPVNWRLSMENLFAKHSIHYKNLPDYALLFGVWSEKNILLSWNDTKDYADLLQLTLCPTLYEGKFDLDLIKSLYTPTYKGDECEGFVLRIADEIHYRDFRKYVGKFVRKGHINTNHHWKFQKVIPNEINKDIWK